MIETRQTIAPELLRVQVYEHFEHADRNSEFRLRLDDFWRSLPQSILSFPNDKETCQSLIDELIRIRLSIDKQRGVSTSMATIRSELPLGMSICVDVENVLRRSQLPSGASILNNAIEAAEVVWKTGDTLGNYRLISQLGKGGMGVVWLAKQSEPIQRDVAVKLIGQGAWDRSMLHRFRREYHAMARLQHPNIAQLLEVAVANNGQPYLVMELVNGPSITKFADINHLSIRQRIELFIPVCHAVQHAHQKGIMHRDLKPSNILVSQTDGVVQAKLIDLGLAKAIMPGAIEPTESAALVTRTGQIIGTLDYMSPEQTRLDDTDVDTRTDVYSLGCVLYELLTSQRPLEGYQLDKLPMEDALQIIRSKQPPGIKSLARVKSRTTPFANLPMGELEWIVSGCMEKDRSLRYATVSDVADELTRWLNGEPIRRAPPNRIYLLRKFIARNRGSVATVGTVFAALFFGLLGTLISLNWAMKEQARAVESKKEALLAKENAEKVTNYITKSFGQASSIQGGHKTRVVDVLDQAIERIDADFPTSSEIKSDILFAFGETLNGLGQFLKAAPLLRKSIEIREQLFGVHEKTLEAKGALLMALYNIQPPHEDLAKLMEELPQQHRAIGAENTFSGLMCRLYAANGETSIEELEMLRDQLLQRHSDRPEAYHAVYFAAKQYYYTGDSELVEERFLKPDDSWKRHWGQPIAIPFKRRLLTMSA